MILTAGAVVGLALRCAPAAALATLLALARVESGLDPFALGVNGAHAQASQPRSQAEAVRRARVLLAAGADVDLGLAQINSRNLARLGLTVEDAFDPCRNLAGGAKLLQEAYATARRASAPQQTALRAALSVYNTGDPTRGRRNGYVGKVLLAADIAPSDAPRIRALTWDVFGDLGPSDFVTASPASEGGPP